MKFSIGNDNVHTTKLDILVSTVPKDTFWKKLVWWRFSLFMLTISTLEKIIKPTFLIKFKAKYLFYLIKTIVLYCFHLPIKFFPLVDIGCIFFANLVFSPCLAQLQDGHSVWLDIANHDYHQTRSCSNALLWSKLYPT